MDIIFILHEQYSSPKRQEIFAKPGSHHRHHLFFAQLRYSNIKMVAKAVSILLTFLSLILTKSHGPACHRPTCKTGKNI